MMPDEARSEHSSTGGMSMSEKISRWNIEGSPERPNSRLYMAADVKDGPDISAETRSVANYLELRTFLLESAEYSWLVRHIDLGLNDSAGDQRHSWDWTPTQLVGAFARLRVDKIDTYETSVTFPWEPREFLNTQYNEADHKPPLRSVITISGSAEDAYACTCEAYVERMWPQAGLHVLDALQSSIDKYGLNTEFKQLASSSTAEPNAPRLVVQLQREFTKLDITGSPLYIIEAIETMTWLSIACRSSDTTNSLRYCSMRLVEAPNLHASDLSYSANLVMETVGHHHKTLHAACWHAMFRNPVIARGYTVPNRSPDERGLEVSVDMMLALARTTWATIYDNKFLLKGFSSILAPVQKIGNSVVWHFIANEDGLRTSYNDGLTHSHFRNLDDVLFDEARHFVGWVHASDFLIGTSGASYDKIQYAGGEPTNSGLRAEAAISISAGKYINLGTKIMRGTKDTPEYLRTEDYIKNMDEATRWKVVLSDVDAREHWLADGASAILHFCRAWLSREHTRYAPEGIAEKIWFPPHAAGPQHSFDTLINAGNRALRLYLSDLKRTSKSPVLGESTQATAKNAIMEEEWFLLQHQAQYFYHWLEQIHDRMVQARHSADIDLIRQGCKTIGFEFKDLLRGDSPVEPYTVELGGGAEIWLKYAKSVDAIHIHGSGFGKLLKASSAPRDAVAECTQSMPFTIGRDYLMAPLSVLREGLERYRHTSTCAQIAYGVYWQNTDDNFLACHCRRPSRESTRCNALVARLHSQYLKASKDQLTTFRLPRVFEQHATGAIILGREVQMLTKPRPVESEAGSKKRSSTGDRNDTKRPRAQGRLLSDSGYGSHVGSSSPPVSHASSQSAGRLSPDADGFRIRGAATESTSRKLTKRIY